MQDHTSAASAPGGIGPALRALPGGIWALGFVSMFMDISSELVHSLLPLFMVGVLGASMTTVGLIEGVAEATASIAKVFSGALSDRLGERKRLAVFGYGLAALTKPIFPLAGSIGWVFAARFLDRVGKGIRGAPRDALVADLTSPPLRGAAYGLRQALDSVGAFVGPLLAIVLMAVFADRIHWALWVAVLPAFIAVALLMAGVREPAAGPHASGAGRPPPRLRELRRLPARYWLLLLFGTVLTLARFSEAFLVLRAQDVGLPLTWVPAIMVVMNVVYATSAVPAGVAADRISARTLLIAGIALLIAADLVLAAAATPLVAFAGAALWGLHMGLTQGLLAKLIADTAPTALRGTAFGFFDLLSGLALLLASVVAGALWSAHGAGATFLAGAVFSALAMIGLLLYRPAPHRAGA
ncbi:MFS transporter [Solimonas variicoloris]|uniref:MFS transporter n=1 Tax=Solimonas variicoloris TaxID=254408 RepID=UPI0003659717|nr:MFS transporter [Solimonas variicoloris]